MHFPNVEVFSLSRSFICSQFEVLFQLKVLFPIFWFYFFKIVPLSKEAAWKLATKAWPCLSGGGRRPPPPSPPPPAPLLVAATDFTIDYLFAISSQCLSYCRFDKMEIMKAEKGSRKIVQRLGNLIHFPRKFKLIENLESFQDFEILWIDPQYE